MSVSLGLGEAPQAICAFALNLQMFLSVKTSAGQSHDIAKTNQDSPGFCDSFAIHGNLGLFAVEDYVLHKRTNQQFQQRCSEEGNVEPVAFNHFGCRSIEGQ